MMYHAAGLLLPDVLNLKHSVQEISPASGVKICFVVISKGFMAIAIQSFTAAERLVVLLKSRAHMKQHNTRAGDTAERGLEGMPSKAYQRVAEMEEIATMIEKFGEFRSREIGDGTEASRIHV